MQHQSPPTHTHEGTDMAQKTGPITKPEVTHAIYKLKSEKASGSDHIPAEMIKASSDVTADIVRYRIQHSSDTEEVPDVWQTG